MEKHRCVMDLRQALKAADARALSEAVTTMEAAKELPSILAAIEGAAKEGRYHISIDTASLVCERHIQDRLESLGYRTRRNFAALTLYIGWR